MYIKKNNLPTTASDSTKTVKKNVVNDTISKEKYSKYLEKQKRKPDAKKYDTCGPNSNQKGAPCGVSKKAAKKG
jgi:hypothetical protein